MRILVINLNSATDRLSFQSEQLTAMGLKFERIEAREAPETPSPAFLERASQWQRPMRKNEIACLNSHETAWKIIATSKEPGLILEDDAVLSSRLPKVLDVLNNFPEVEHVTLEVRGRKKILANSAKAITPKDNLRRLYQDRTGAAAYILTPEGASKLLAKSKKAAGLADAIIASNYALSSWQLEPALAFQLDQCAQYGLTSPIDPTTSIGTSETQKPVPKNSIQALRFKARRLLAQMRMGWRQISVLTIARRRHVEVEIDDFRAHIPPNDSLN